MEAVTYERRTAFMIRCTGKKIKVMSKRQKHHAIAWTLVVIGYLGFIAAFVAQFVLCWMNGTSLSENGIIPHWSLGLAGTLLLHIPATVIYILGGD